MTTEEKIKNGIEELIKDAIPEGCSIAPGTNITKEEALKWLEEQGKHGDSLNDADLELEVAKYFQGYWPGMKTPEACNHQLVLTPPAIMRMIKHFYERGLSAKNNE